MSLALQVQTRNCLGTSSCGSRGSSSNSNALECPKIKERTGSLLPQMRIIPNNDLPKYQRSQVEECRRLSLARAPCYKGEGLQETELLGNGESQIKLSHCRKFKRGRFNLLKVCHERKFNYGNEPTQATCGTELKLIAQRQSSSSTSNLLKLHRLRKHQPKSLAQTTHIYVYLLISAILFFSHIVQPASLKSVEDSSSRSANIESLQTLSLNSVSENSKNSLLETSTSSLPTTTVADQDQNDSGAQDDDNDAEGCKGLSVGDTAEAKNYTDNERLVNLQACIQRKIESHLNGSKRFGLEMFEKLSISGGCSSSIMSLVGSLNGIKSFAFKFLDATAKIPSGLMYGLLSDFGDFDQCLSIRSKPNVDPENEADEGAYSGKYCLVSVKLNYHARLEGNSTVPEGIIEDGVLWDELVRNYWTTKSPKGFQAGVCLPSRCTRDDLDQIYRHVADSYNVVGEIINCQDSLDLKNQYKPDFIQNFIIYTFYLIINLVILGTVLDRYYPIPTFASSTKPSKSSLCFTNKAFCLKLLQCFSVQRNWKIFIRTTNPNSNYWDCLAGTGSTRSSTDSSSDLNENASIDSRDTIERVTALTNATTGSENSENLKKEICTQLTVQIQPIDSANLDANVDRNINLDKRCSLQHLSGLRLLIIVWITIGHSFLYPSANNYQYYRSIINMKITRDSVWFATTNFTLGIDMLLYMTGLLFVYKLAHLSPTLRASLNSKTASRAYKTDERLAMRLEFETSAMAKLILKKILRFWPTYLTLIGLAILVPLLSDGPMWPEMVSKRLGESCRHNWWSNLLFINNFLIESDICLPSSWFVSILMQLFLSGSLIILLVRRYSLKVALILLVVLLFASSGLSFAFAYLYNVRAPMIRMDESFVMELDENIFRLYTTFFNNLGPFLIGMIGGFMMINVELTQASLSPNQFSAKALASDSYTTKIKQRFMRLACGVVVAIIAALVLSSVFHTDYSRFWAAIYWSLHRVGWAMVTGYIIHNCATGRCNLLNDILSISTFIPINKLIPIAYLVYPIYIHIHSGLVRDGLHVSIYNMLNIYTTRLVLTFTTALFIHLMVELPFCSIVDLYISRLIQSNKITTTEKDEKVEARFHPLLAIAPNVALDFISDKTPVDTAAPNNESINKTISDTNN